MFRAWGSSVKILIPSGQLQERLIWSATDNFVRVRLLGIASPKFLKTDGILVYSVCSTWNPKKPNWLMEDFLRNHPEFDIYSMSDSLKAENYPATDDLKTAGKRSLYISMSINGMDGFFCGCLYQTAEHRHTDNVNSCNKQMC